MGVGIEDRDGQMALQEKRKKILSRHPPPFQVLLFHFCRCQDVLSGIQILVVETKRGFRLGGIRHGGCERVATYCLDRGCIRQGSIRQ
jgi:hypothetical protein